MNYTEDFYGIKYSAKRGGTLEIIAAIEEFKLNCWDGVLNLMSKDGIGRTALFMEDCSFFQGKNEWLIKVIPGSASYIKELWKVRPVSRLEFDQHKLGRLW